MARSDCVTAPRRAGRTLNRRAANMGNRFKRDKHLILTPNVVVVVKVVVWWGGGVWC